MKNADRSRCLLLVLIASILFNSCMGKYSISKEDLKSSDITIKYNNISIVFANDSMDKILTLSNKLLATKKLGANEISPILESDYGSFIVKYYETTKELIAIEIVKRDASILGGIRVGDSRKATQGTLIGGVYNRMNKSYLFVCNTTIPDVTLGYLIFFDSRDRIKNIYIDRFSDEK